MWQEEPIKYQKKKNSDKSKADRKSDHKHQYDKVVIFEYEYLGHIYYMGVWYCSICGKIGDQTETRFPWGWRMTKEDWKKKYSDAKWVKLENSLSWFKIRNINELLEEK